MFIEVLVNDAGRFHVEPLLYDQARFTTPEPQRIRSRAGNRTMQSSETSSTLIG